MSRTLELLEKAEKRYVAEGKTSADLSRELGMEKTATAVAKYRGNIPPVMAGRLAQILGEDAIKWIAIAAVEGAKNSKARTMLEKHLQAVVKG
jgi:plasmid maintenance system antidote protein VapI